MMEQRITSNSPVSRAYLDKICQLIFTMFTHKRYVLFTFNCTIYKYTILSHKRYSMGRYNYIVNALDINIFYV